MVLPLVNANFGHSNYEKGMRQEKRKKRGGVKFCFLRMPKLLKLIFCIWIRRP